MSGDTCHTRGAPGTEGVGSGTLLSTIQSPGYPTQSTQPDMPTNELKAPLSPVRVTADPEAHQPRIQESAKSAPGPKVPCLESPSPPAIWLPGPLCPYSLKSRGFEPRPSHILGKYFIRWADFPAQRTQVPCPTTQS